MRFGKQVLYDFFPEGHDRRLQGYMHGVSGIFIQGRPCYVRLHRALAFALRHALEALET